MIEEKAMDLGRTLGQSTEYQALRRAEQALRDNPEAQQRLESISKLTAEFDQLIAQGQSPSEEQAASYETTLREFEMSPAGQAYLVARTNVDKLMQRVNQAIGEGIERGATSSIITL
jgi:cell fate (sporulation/competence/biofilm development) regulator YlbF (YheA/YmcA/DUF963 family)